MAFNNITASEATWTSKFIGEGITTIVWGTEGLYSGYIVMAAREETRVEEIDIMQGAGFTAIVVLLYDGNNVELTVIDDTNIQPPAIGGIVSLLSPYGATINMLCVDNNADQERKREGHRVLRFRSYNAINGIN